MKKRTEPTFWIKDNRYFMLTGETWQGCVFIALSGETPEKVCEHGMAQNHMEGAEQVEPWSVPLEWWRVFAALCDKIPPNPPSRPEPEPEPEPVEDEMLMHIAAGTDPLTAALAASDRLRRRAYKPIKGPCPASFCTGIVVGFFIVVALLLWM